MTTFNKPLVFLGDHAFNTLYSKRQFSEAEILELMRHAVDRGLTGIAVGEPRLLQIACDVRASNPEVRVMYHTDTPMLYASEPLSPDLSASLAHGLISANPRYSAILEDPISGRWFLFHDAVAFHPELLRFDIDRAAREIEIIRSCRPEFVSVGGDIFDLLLLGEISERFEQIDELFIGALSNFASLVLATYIAPCLDYVPSRKFSALMVSLNPCGIGALPDPGTTESWIVRTGLPVYAMHSLCGGMVHPSLALLDLHIRGYVNGAVVGASTKEHISTLGNAFKLWKEAC
jgi:hypothetical protein